MQAPPNRAELVRYLSGLLAQRLAPAAVDPDADLFELGLDSVDAVEVTGELEAAFQLEVDPELLFECRTVNRAADRLQGGLGRR